MKKTLRKKIISLFIFTIIILIISVVFSLKKEQILYVTQAKVPLYKYEDREAFVKFEKVAEAKTGLIDIYRKEFRFNKELEDFLVVKISMRIPCCYEFDSKGYIKNKDIFIEPIIKDLQCDCGSRIHIFTFYFKADYLKYSPKEYNIYLDDTRVNSQLYKNCSKLKKNECQSSLQCRTKMGPSCPSCEGFTFIKCIPDPEKETHKEVCNETDGKWEKGSCTCKKEKGKFVRMYGQVYRGCLTNRELCTETRGEFKKSKCICPEKFEWTHSGGCIEKIN